ncbi:MAG TPA: DUF2254 domain-containing protein [Anaerolineales bacterium]|nr:DUF2254 domain-containing protein [Anaerolineales bacterium]
MRKLWEDIRGSYWFVPGLMVIGAILLSLATVSLDGYYQIEVLRRLGFIWSGGAEGARGLLQTVAGSMITVAGVTFSITMVALSFASSQFGSRLLRNFMSDTGNQLVLGTFVATFIYCLLILRTVRSDGDTEFVPYISVTVGLALALLSLIVLIYFFHHMALSMQAPYIVGEVAGDLLQAIERLFPSEVGTTAPKNDEQRNEHDIPQNFEEQAQPVHSEVNGYIQAIDESELMTIAREEDLIVKLLHRPGHFQVEGEVLAYFWPADQPNDKLEHRLNSAMITGKQRTYTQDVEFGIEQLVEVAERSLSTGINATFTAVACIDWLGAALAKLMKKGFPSPYRYDREGNLRIFFERPLTLEGVIDTAFNQIRQSARDNVAVRIRLLEQIAILHEMTDDPRVIQELERHAKMIEDGNENHVLQKEDEKEVHQRYREATAVNEDKP